ncbi:MAG: MaoC family dehydratase N-terminal domain-containing protein [Dehalococcoidia bacterium]|jgi:acyl dehydratase|nr:MaoC family dehydratase N-terminal domain-containing protein [Dehalococcoidia bacterium]|tara:strand:+ start:632 stop:1075 length:444 start_codon:yes stop_codon:yes gene_type:complete
MIEKARRFEDIQIGDEITPLVKEIGMARMMAYGAATWDFIRLHYDADYARELGFESPFVDGQMMGGFLTQHVQDWAGPGAFLRKLAFRNRVMAYPGDSLTCHGVVTDVSSTEEGGMVECDLWMENQRGEKVVDPASALLRFPLIAGS